MASADRGDDSATDPILAVAEAATTAAHDALAALHAASAAVLEAQHALDAAAADATRAEDATADSVAAAATSTSDIAAWTAAAVETQAVGRAFEVAAAAVAALETIARQTSDDIDADDATRAAVSMAATVAHAAMLQAKATVEAASLVEAAVVTAAENAAQAAAAAAETVALAASSAVKNSEKTIKATAESEAATHATVVSISRTADLVPRLRTIAALRRRVGMLRQAPLAAELHDALARNELLLHYQPIYSMHTGSLVAVEALLRWQHPDRGLLHPGDFLDVAEGRALLNPISDWILSTAISQAGSWRGQSGVDCPDVWVNISVDQLAGGHLLPLLERLLTEADLAPARLGLEVTERQLIEGADAVETELRALRDLGLSLAVDDFGTGYASLDYLRRFAFDEIKIDRSFVAAVGHDETATAIASSIVTLGRSLDLAVVAEGIETQHQYDALLELGCPLGQGYLLQRPAPPEVIGQLLCADETTRPD